MSNESALRSALVSLGFAAWTSVAVVFAFAVGDNAAGSPTAFCAWLATHWWPILVGLVINPGPWYRARQSILNAQKGT